MLWTKAEYCVIKKIWFVNGGNSMGVGAHEGEFQVLATPHYLSWSPTVVFYSLSAILQTSR